MNNETKTCYYCGNDVELENGVQWGSYFYCDECFKDLKCKVDSYHHPSLETKFRKTDEDGEGTILYLGPELETTKDANGYFYQSDHQDDILHIRKNYKNIGRSINFEQDASIGNGKEFVFFPMTINYIYKNEDEFKEMFKYLISKGNYSHDKGKCGLHVHVSRNFLGDNEDEIQKTIEKIMLFVETYRTKVEKFARRKHNQFSSYNTYTIPYHKQYRPSDDFTDEYFKSGKLLKELNEEVDRIGHSSVVNTRTSTGQTIEFRMFRGTLKFETFMATMEFVYNLVNVCKNNQVSKISWNKVINYSGKYIKDYNDSLDLIDDGLYLRDYTSQLEDIITKRNETTKETLDKYKNDLNDIANSLMGLVNEPIDFTQSDMQVIKDTISFRNSVYDTLRNVLITDETNTTSLYQRLKKMGTDYSDTCRNGLKTIKSALNNSVLYNLTETTKGHIEETKALIDTKLEETTSTQGEC
jgi:hypothetical protein